MQTPMEAIRLNPLIPSYKEKFIKDLSKEDVKVALSGFIVSKSEGKLIIGDNTGSIAVEVETTLDVNDFVRVFGVLLPYDEGYEVQGHFIQNLSDADADEYLKVKSLLQ